MLGSGRIFYRQADSFPKVFNSRPTVRHVKSARKSGKKIVIPPRIEREPTDILKALASTVNLDPTAFHYKFPDDPFFYPYTATEKRVYALSLESGRKSAKWVINENPGFFKHQLADPPIEAFLPKISSTDETECTEESLINAITERNVSNAITIYNNLKSKNEGVQKFVKQSLLELVCFFNSEDKPNLDLESKWFEGYLGKAGSEIQKKDDWNVRGFANTLFEEMDSGCPLANSAIIQGMLKYNDINSALGLYEAARVKKMKLSVGVYNALLSESFNIVNNRAKIFEFVMDELNEMAKENVHPNLGTLNAALKALSNTGRVTSALNLVKEFLKLGVEPSLGSYGYLFKTFSRVKPSPELECSVKNFMEEILEYIEKKDHEILHPCDLKFFTNAMDAVVEGSGDGRLALRLLDMYLKPNNLKFIVKAADEHAFFKQLFLVVFKTQPIDVAMDIYRRYIFTNMSPESRVLSAIIAAIHENLTPEYLYELWKSLGKLGYAKNRPVLGKILAMSKDFTDETSLKIFHQAAINFLQKLEEFKSGDEEYIPDVLAAFVKCGDDENIFKLLSIIKENNLLVNMPENLAEALLEHAMSNNNVPLIIETLKMASNMEVLSTSEMAKKALPLLRGGDEAWASGLIAERKSEKTT